MRMTWMVFGKGIVVGMLALGLAGMGLALRAQPPGGAPQQVPAGQQNVPDAPKPQTLPRLNTIVPAAPALPDAPAAQAPAATTTAPAATEPGATLPSTSQAQATKPSPDEPELPAPGQGAQAFRLPEVRVNFVEVPFTVKDNKSRLVPGLTWRDVQIFENGRPRKMALFTVDPFPLSVALVIDQSVTFDTMTKINNSLAALQGAFTPYDEVAVFTYNNGVKEQTQPTPEAPTGFLAAQSARLGVILDRSKAVGREPNMDMGGPLACTTCKNNQAVDPETNRGNTGPSIQVTVPKEYHTLNDAILAAAEATAKAAPGRRRIVYVISDGKEYGSEAREKDVIRYLQTNKVAVYATLVGDSAVPGLGFLDRIHLPLTMRDNALPRYAGATGGQIDPEFRQGGIEKSFARITEEVRTQYTVGYYSNEPVYDGKFRKLEVRVLKPNLTVIAKDGYYPTASDSRPAPVTPAATP